VAQVLNDGESCSKTIKELSLLVLGFLCHSQTQPQTVQKELAVMKQNTKINNYAYETLTFILRTQAL
jgi:hypothetical protein